MSNGLDISVVVVFHTEGALCLPALASLKGLVVTAQGDGLTVETIAILDAPDSETRRLVLAAAKDLSRVEEVSFRDLGLTRNHAAQLARGHYLSFLDGDDLWGAQWLRSAFRAATAVGAPLNAIWHPQAMYLFDESDFDRTSLDRTPHPQAHTLYLIHEASDSESFDRRTLLLENTWGAVAFARRAVFLEHPYLAVDPAKGFGIEDWSWNIETLTAGFAHKVVEGTVHLHREKKTDRLGVQNLIQGLLPFMPELSPLTPAEFMSGTAAAAENNRI